MEGFEDPFNRRTFPWGWEDGELVSWFTALGQARKTLAPLRKGDLRWLAARDRVVVLSRSYGGETLMAAVNAGDQDATVDLPGAGRFRLEAMTGHLLRWDGESVQVIL